MYARILQPNRACVLTSIVRYHSKSGVYGYKLKQRAPQFEQNIDESALANRIRHCNLYQLVEAYRRHGHKKASLDPLELRIPRSVNELNPAQYGLSLSDPQTYNLNGILHTSSPAELTITELVQRLEQHYCGHIAVEFDHLQTLAEREWFAQAFESKAHDLLTPERKVKLAKLFLHSQAFDNFLANKFSTVKRYGAEGGETVLGFYDELFNRSAQGGISNILVCMAHRGRLNFLTSLLNYPPVILFKKMRGHSEFPAGQHGEGDVLSHLFTSVDLSYDDKALHVSFLPNPSHLEAVNPVATGKTRAKQLSQCDGDYSLDAGSSSSTDDDDVNKASKVLCLLIHGDGAFSGQGVIAEMFAMSQCPHYSVGGTIHLIINNQLGFTTDAESARSSTYTSDTAKMCDYPVIHVNGDDPEAIAKATALALDYRMSFNKDIVVDLYCFRKWGHNELDEASFTQPLMYQAINSRASVPAKYAESVVTDGLCEKEELTQSVTEWNAYLTEQLSQVDSYTIQAMPHPSLATLHSRFARGGICLTLNSLNFNFQKTVQPYHLKDQWSGMGEAGNQVTSWDTGLSLDLLRFVGARSVQVPDDLAVHQTITKTHIERRLQRLQEGTSLDWATGEALAIGSLLYQGYTVRISGQDVGRGTFSQRHAIIVDQNTDDMYIPLNHITTEQSAFFEVANSILSEEAVLGFEYGMSLDSPKRLVIWEAQFGDFVTGAQIIIDTFITGGESKWLLQSGLVILLPHGYDGAGPEHSSAKIERFLQLCDSKETGVDGDNVNIGLANPTTPAQYYHLLRRQMVRNFRKPLVIFSPKMLLRHPSATSPLAAMSSGTTFHPVLTDSDVQPNQVKRVVFCSGKHYYTLHKERETRQRPEVALVRLEALCPFPVAELQAEVQKYSGATEFLWSQEEHRNMGAWTFVSRRFENLLGLKLDYVGRNILGIPATGIGAKHQQEMQQLVDDTFR